MNRCSVWGSDIEICWLCQSAKRPSGPGTVSMIQPTSGSRIYLASGITYMRKGDARPVGVGESDVEQRALVGDVFEN